MRRHSSWKPTHLLDSSNLSSILLFLSLLLRLHHRCHHHIIRQDPFLPESMEYALLAFKLSTHFTIFCRETCLTFEVVAIFEQQENGVGYLVNIKLSWSYTLTPRHNSCFSAKKEELKDLNLNLNSEKCLLVAMKRSCGASSRSLNFEFESYCNSLFSGDSMGFLISGRCSPDSASSGFDESESFLSPAHLDSAADFVFPR